MNRSIFCIKPHACFVLGIIGVYTLAIIIQSNILLNWDVSWLMHASSRLLAGGSYTKDFFEMNPPMILYLYIPPVLLNKFFSINMMIALRIYIFLLSSLSLFICYLFVKKIFIDKDKVIAYLFLLAIAICFLILPLYEFGQRENLLIILTIPYFLMITYRLQGYSMNPYYAIGIGFFAGLAFALKPFFLIPLAFVELYYIFSTHRLFAWIRAETLTIIFILMIYVLSIFIFQSDYLFTAIPLFTRIYYSGFSFPFYVIIFYRPLPFCFAALLFAIVQYQNTRYQPLIAILMVALIGFLIVFFIPRTAWYYHILPAYTFSILLLAVLLSLLLFQAALVKEFIFIALLSIFIFYFPFHYSYYIYEISIHYKEKYDKLIAFMQLHAAHQPVYFFATVASSTYPAVDYAHSIPASRIAYMGWVPGMINLMNIYQSDDRLKQLHKDKNFFINMIVADLNIKKPTLVFIDVSHPKPYLGLSDFDYLNYFSDNQSFQKAWRAYRYFTTIEEKGFYKYAVYRRC